MAELLVAARDLLGGDPAQDAVRYRQGDVVVVMPDGHVWGGAEGLPDFWQIRVVSLLDADRLSCVEPTYSPFFIARIMERRRKRFIDTAQLSAQARASLASSGTATITRLGLVAALTLRP